MVYFASNFSQHFASLFKFSAIVLCSWNSHLFPSIALGLLSYYWACECLYVTLYVSGWVCLFCGVVCVCVKQCFRFWVLIPAAHGFSHRTIRVLFEHWAKRPRALKLLAFPRAFLPSFLFVHESESRVSAVKFKRVCLSASVGWQRFYNSTRQTFD